MGVSPKSLTSSARSVSLPLRDQYPTLWTARQVARELNLSLATVYRHAESGKFPSIKIGGALRFPVDQLLTVLTKEGEWSSIHVPFEG